MLFFYFIKREQDQTQMYDLQLSDESLTGDVTSTVEVYARLEKKWIGTSKHVQTLQEDLDTQIKKYDAKMDSISDDFMRVNNSINNTKELLLKKIESLREELEDLTDQFKSHRRKTKRDIDDIMITKIPRIEDDIKGITDSLDVILSLESIRKEIEKAAKEQAKEQ